jgi:hypothetical protein
MQNPGGGLAPWNIQQYLVEDKNGRVFITDKQKATTAPMVFYHFHGLKFYSDDKVACCGALYEIDKNVKEILYFPYIRHLLEVGDKIVRSGFKLNPQGARQPSPGPGKVLSEYIKNVIFLMLKGRLPLFKKSLFKITLHNHIYKLSRIKK